MDSKEFISSKMYEDTISNLIAVRVFWRDPFGCLSMRVGYFEEAWEAKLFETMLNDTYKKYDYPHVVTFTGEVKDHRDIPQLMLAKCTYK